MFKFSLIRSESRIVEQFDRFVEFGGNSGKFFEFGGFLLVDIAVEGFRAVNHVSESSLNANKDVFTTLLASTVSCWLGSVLLSYVLGIRLGLGLLGCWIAFASDEGIKAVIYIIRWKSGRWLKCK